MAQIKMILNKTKALITKHNISVVTCMIMVIATEILKSSIMLKYEPVVNVLALEGIFIGCVILTAYKGGILAPMSPKNRIIFDNIVYGRKLTKRDGEMISLIREEDIYELIKYVNQIEEFLDYVGAIPKEKSDEEIKNENITTKN